LLALRGFAARTQRLGLVVGAVALATALISGTFVFTDTLSAASAAAGDAVAAPADSGGFLAGDAQTLADQLAFVKYLLTLFGDIALLVGTFLIYNTFAMVVGQRARELGLLRALGATRAQVTGSIVAEAALAGLLGGAAGAVSGVGLARIAQAGLAATGDGDFASSPLALHPRTFSVAIVVGLVAAVVSAYAPARRAGAASPIAAIRGDLRRERNRLPATRRSTRASNRFPSARLPLAARSAGPEHVYPSLAPLLPRRRLPLAKPTRVGLVLGLMGIFTLGAGVAVGGAPGAIAVGCGALLLIAALLPLLPALAKGAVLLARPAAERAFGAIGRLAAANVVRNPARTATTAFALALGVMLVCVVGVLAASAQRTLAGGVQIDADFIATGASGGPLSAAAVASLQSIPGVGQSVALYPRAVTWGGGRVYVGQSAAGDVGAMIDARAALESLTIGDGRAALSRSDARPGDFGLTAAEPSDSGLYAVAVYENGALFGPILVPQSDYERIFPKRTAVNALAVRAATGASPAQIGESLKALPDVRIMTPDEFRGDEARQANAVVGGLYGLLALSVVIAILGIANTLALSVAERSAEIGMLRAVGATRAHVRRMICLEAAFIAVIGALAGVALGLLFGWAFAATLAQEGLAQFAVPWGQVALMLAGSAAAGVAAAWWPARAAAKTRPLAAIAAA
jgi:putative ABC transport system permease protein